MSDSDQPKSAVVQVEGAAIPVVTMSATARTRMHFAVQHLLAAARFARDVDAAEPRDQSVSLGDFFDTVLERSVGCVILCAAGLEAYVNEIFADREQHFASQSTPLLDAIWQEYERKQILEKFDLALLLLGKGKLDRGSASVQRVDRLILLRNALLHFHPEWLGTSKSDHEKLAAKLANYVNRSPWFPDEPLFPRAWATRGTTAWAVGSSIVFLKEFSVLAGFPSPIDKFLSRLGTAAAP